MQTGCEAAQSSLSCVTILTIVLVVSPGLHPAVTDCRIERAVAVVVLVSIH